MATRKKPPRALDAELNALGELARFELKQRWEGLFGVPCPARMSRAFLLRAVAHRMQEQVLGGVDRAMRRRLERAAADLAAGRPSRHRSPTSSPGRGCCASGKASPTR